MFAVLLLVLLLGIAIGAALVLAHHEHDDYPNSTYPDLDAMQSVNRLFEASAQARRLMLDADQERRQSPRRSFGDKAP